MSEKLGGNTSKWDQKSGKIPIHMSQNLAQLVISGKIRGVKGISPGRVGPNTFEYSLNEYSRIFGGYRANIRISDRSTFSIEFRFWDLILGVTAVTENPAISAVSQSRRERWLIRTK